MEGDTIEPQVSDPIENPTRPAAVADPGPAEEPLEPSAKGLVFVAMPFAEEFEDVYQFGIYETVRRHGFVCEQVGQAAFTGDILQRIREKIANAELVIADLTHSRPNVYLEVGYAWGRQVPVVIIAREGEDLHFDVQGHRTIIYRNISHLAKRHSVRVLPESRQHF